MYISQHHRFKSQLWFSLQLLPTMHPRKRQVLTQYLSPCHPHWTFRLNFCFLLQLCPTLDAPGMWEVNQILSLIEDPAFCSSFSLSIPLSPSFSFSSSPPSTSSSTFSFLLPFPPSHFPYLFQIKLTNYCQVCDCKDTALKAILKRKQRKVLKSKCGAAVSPRTASNDLIYLFGDPGKTEKLFKEIKAEIVMIFSKTPSLQIQEAQQTKSRRRTRIDR